MTNNPAGRGRRPTLRDVAHAAGVSVWTVSNAYSRPDRVASATRERVLAAATAIGYSGPDPVARSLALGRTGIVALQADGDAEPLLADPAVALMARGLIHACDAAGLSVLFAGRLGEVAVDGAVHLRVSPQTPATHPRVTIDAPGGDAGPTVRADVAGAGAAMARHLRELGHEAIAWVAVPSDPATATERGRALDAVAGIRIERIPARGQGYEEGRKLAPAVLASGATAVVAFDGELAPGLLAGLREAGIEIPGRLSVVGGGPPSDPRSRLTTMTTPFAEMGAAAIDLLGMALRGATAAPALRAVRFDARLEIRGSTGRAPP